MPTRNSIPLVMVAAFVLFFSVPSATQAALKSTMSAKLFPQAQEAGRMKVNTRAGNLDSNSVPDDIVKQLSTLNHRQFASARAKILKAARDQVDPMFDFDKDGFVNWSEYSALNDALNGISRSQSKFLPPFEISSLEELQAIEQRGLDGSYILVNDIDASPTNPSHPNFDPFGFWSDEKGFKPIGNLYNGFVGSFDGRNYKITGLYINRPNESWIGLFGGLGSLIDSLQGEVLNVGVEFVNITGNTSVGGLVGFSFESQVSNSYVTGDIEGRGSYVGGLIGSFRTRGNVVNCAQQSFAITEVKGQEFVGGLVGWNEWGIIKDSYAMGSVEGVNGVGGLVGWLDIQSELVHTYAVTNASGISNVGGLVGVLSFLTNIDASYYAHDAVILEGATQFVGQTTANSLQSQSWLEQNGNWLFTEKGAPWTFNTNLGDFPLIVTQHIPQVHPNTVLYGLLLAIGSEYTNFLTPINEADNDFNLDDNHYPSGTAIIDGTDQAIIRDFMILPTSQKTIVREKVLHAVSTRFGVPASGQSYIAGLDVDQSSEINQRDYDFIQYVLGAK